MYVLLHVSVDKMRLLSNVKNWYSWYKTQFSSVSEHVCIQIDYFALFQHPQRVKGFRQGFSVIVLLRLHFITWHKLHGKFENSPWYIACCNNLLFIYMQKSVEKLRYYDRKVCNVFANNSMLVEVIFAYLNMYN